MIETMNITGGEVCTGDFHVYPKTYAGDPKYAASYLNRCLCGKKRKVTTVTEADTQGTDLLSERPKANSRQAEAQSGAGEKGRL